MSLSDVEAELSQRLAIGEEWITKKELMELYNIASLVTCREYLSVCGLPTSSTQYHIEKEIRTRFHLAYKMRQEKKSMAQVRAFFQGKDIIPEDEDSLAQENSREQQQEMSGFAIQLAERVMQQALEEAFDQVMQPDVLVPMVQRVIANRMRCNSESIRKSMKQVTEKKLLLPSEDLPTTTILM